MNTIPLTLDDRKTSYAVVGGRGCPGNFPVSVVILNRGPRIYRAALVQDILDAGFDSLISVETGRPSPELEGVATRFPQLRFILLRDDVSVGEQINIAMREACSPYVFVIWNDMRLASSALSARFFDRVAELDAACLVPQLSSADGSVVPSVMHPALAGQALRCVPLPPAKDGEGSLFPYDYCGIYSRERFVLSGGFDWTISQAYWQLMDFGMRLWLWGERVSHAQALKIRYQGSPPDTDLTPDASYARFWLKNLAPRHRGDSAYLPGRRFFRFLLSSRLGPVEARNEFLAARTWVKANEYRFKQDAARLVNLWDPLP
ncbi:MAG: hypothetical protein JW923_11370 [Spirochaetales bacterium]|nr:hypothetical protein [Spirochaetales bacterium]MBP7264357.1 hypothetical protein [Spirochaetia bacterium]